MSSYENRAEDRGFYNLEEHPFHGRITDPDIEEAFKAKWDKLEYKLDVSELLIKLKHHWNDEILAELATTPVDEYRRVFKQNTGKDLRQILAGALQFDRISNASPEMMEISKRTKEALRQIGMESEINAHRVAKFGVKIESWVQGPKETET